MYIEIINEEFDPWQKLVDYKKSKLKDKKNIGACSVFLGTMRDINSGEEIKSMELQHYPEMTQSYLEKISENATNKYKIIGDNTGNNDGITISLIAALVNKSTSFP